MSPITKKSEAKDGGFAQVRAALQKFAGDVTKAEFGQWGGQLVDENGNPKPPREFLEVENENVEVLETTEELSMEVTEWNFRENCSDFNGSFWVDKFLESADKHKVQIPDGLLGKRIIWEKVTLAAFDKDGNPKPQYNSTNYIIAGIVTDGITPAPAPAQAPAVVDAEETIDVSDPMAMAMELAVGKTEQQFRTAIGLDPRFQGNPVLQLAKAGAVTAALVNDGKLTLVKQGSKEVYQKVE